MHYRQRELPPSTSSLIRRSSVRELLAHPDTDPTQKDSFVESVDGRGGFCQETAEEATTRKEMLEGREQSPQPTRRQRRAPPRTERNHSRLPVMAKGGVDPTLVSPAAKSITREPIASSCRDQTDHTGSRGPKSAWSVRRSRGVSASLANAAAPVLSESSEC
jgi:hypothetical protein